MSNGLTRLQTRFLDDAAKVAALLAHDGPFNAADAEEAGLVTFAPDEIDWDDEVRLAVEARAAFSPDAMTGLEANLRFAGPETMETKIFGRLTAWQNWIFQRPERGRRKGRAEGLRTAGQAGIRLEAHLRTLIDHRGHRGHRRHKASHRVQGVLRSVSSVSFVC